MEKKELAAKNTKSRQQRSNETVRSLLRTFAFSAAPLACLLALGSVSSALADPPARPEVIRLTTDGHLKQRPAWSPDGKSLLFTRHQGATIFLYVLSLDGKTERRLTATKDPEFDGVFSPDGKRIAFSFDKASPNQGDIDVHTILPDGTDVKAVAATEGKLSHEEWPAWSPDSLRIAYSSTRDDNQEIYVAKADGSEKKRLTTDPALDAHPAWSPDGKQIAFATSRWGDLELAVMNADGSGLVRLTKSPGLDDYPAWSPDGKQLAFTSNRDGNLEIYTIDPDGQNPRNETKDPAIDNFPAWTSNGRLTFVSNRDGGFDVYVAAVSSSRP